MNKKGSNRFFAIRDMDQDVAEQSQSQIFAPDLPEPESLTPVTRLPRYPPRSDLTPKGYLGALVRTIKNVPPCVWVVNQHSEEITVVVSRYKPNRLLTSAGISTSLTGAGINFATTTFDGPATRKTLSAHENGLEYSSAVFPLWTRKDGFGVISVFKGPEQRLFIENDQVPLGAMAYFTGQPDLSIVNYQ